MSKTEILKNSKLTKAERFEIGSKLAELYGDDWLDDSDPLNDEEKSLIDARIEDQNIM